MKRVIEKGIVSLLLIGGVGHGSGYWNQVGNGETVLHFMKLSIEGEKNGNLTKILNSPPVNLDKNLSKKIVVGGNRIKGLFLPKKGGKKGKNSQNFETNSTNKSRQGIIHHKSELHHNNRLNSNSKNHFNEKKLRAEKKPSPQERLKGVYKPTTIKPNLIPKHPIKPKIKPLIKPKIKPIVKPTGKIGSEKNKNTFSTGFYRRHWKGEGGE